MRARYVCTACLCPFSVPVCCACVQHVHKRAAPTLHACHTLTLFTHSAHTLCTRYTRYTRYTVHTLHTLHTLRVRSMHAECMLHASNLRTRTALTLHTCRHTVTQDTARSLHAHMRCEHTHCMLITCMCAPTHVFAAYHCDSVLKCQCHRANMATLHFYTYTRYDVQLENKVDN